MLLILIQSPGTIFFASAILTSRLFVERQYLFVDPVQTETYRYSSSATFVNWRAGLRSTLRAATSSSCIPACAFASPSFAA